MLQSQLLAAGETINPLLPALPDLVWSAVVFVVILVFFWFRVLPNVKALLDARSAAIEGNIEKASAAQQEAEAALATYTAQLAEARAEAMLRAVMAGAELGSYEPAVRSLNARHGEIGEIDWSLGGAGRREEPRASAVVSTTPSRSSLLQGGNFVWANKRLMVLD